MSNARNLGDMEAQGLKHTLTQALTQAWNGQNTWKSNPLGQFLALVLRPVSWMFGGLVSVRRALYQRGFYSTHTLSVPVIVVGNVMVGGVGKTPITMAVVQHLKAQGWRVGVLSRGYGRKTSSTLAVTPSSNPHNVGDEPLLIARRCQVPVFVGISRVDAGHALLSLHPDVQVLVCDDGLQHLALERDLELCVFDERGIGNGHLLPAGPAARGLAAQAAAPGCITPRSTLLGRQELRRSWLERVRCATPFGRLRRAGRWHPTLPQQLVEHPRAGLGWHCQARGVFCHAPRARPECGAYTSPGGPCRSASPAHRRRTRRCAVHRKRCRQTLGASPQGLGCTATNHPAYRTLGRDRPASRSRTTRKVIITPWTTNCLNSWSAL